MAADPEKRSRAVWSVIGIVATFAAWAALVYYAIQLGGQVKSGDAGAWVLLVIAVLGAVCCLFLSLLLGTRIIDQTRNDRATRPPRLVGGRRARR